MKRPATLAGFIHRWIPADPNHDPGYVLLLLHGTGGNEDDLIPLADLLAPGAAVLSPRGRVLEAGMPRFFRRIEEGVFDVEDLKFRAAELATFIAQARDAYDMGDRRVVALGFSNGANIAGGLLLGHPDTLAGAALLRPMVPYQPDVLPRLDGRPVFIAAGTLDPFGHTSEIARYTTLLENCGARITLHVERAGHQLVRGDFEATREWLGNEFERGK